MLDYYSQNWRIFKKLDYCPQNVFASNFVFEILYLTILSVSSETQMSRSFKWILHLIESSVLHWKKK